MKALVLEEYGRLVVADVPDPVPGRGEVLVRVRACGICGSDAHGMDGSTGRRRPPLIMGHEAAGEVVATGPSAGSWKRGDRVALDSTVFCGDCWHCHRGEVNLCEQRRVLGVSCAEYRRDGAFAEYVAVPERILHRIPDAVTFEQASMAETLAVAVHAVSRAPAVAESSALVVGAGMVGLLVIQVLRASGCRKVIAVDIDGGRLELARKFGAAATIDPSSRPPAAAVIELTGGRGADLSFEVVGRSDTLGTAIDSVRKGGHVVLVGNLAASVDLPLQSVVTRQLTLAGSCASSGEYPRSLELIASGAVDVSALVSAVAPLADGAAWFGRLHAREKGLTKVLLKP
ncbi:MAG TPA: galactitol-1-phosphate 5-dehydrogenase [Opitutaceae bacterium]